MQHRFRRHDLYQRWAYAMPMPCHAMSCPAMRCQAHVPCSLTTVRSATHRTNPTLVTYTTTTPKVERKSSTSILPCLDRPCSKRVRLRCRFPWPTTPGLLIRHPLNGLHSAPIRLRPPAPLPFSLAPRKPVTPVECRTCLLACLLVFAARLRRKTSTHPTSSPMLILKSR